MFSRKILARSFLTATVIALLPLLQTMLWRGNDTAAMFFGWRSFVAQLVYFYLWALAAFLLAPFFTRFPLADQPSRHALYYTAVGLASSAVTLGISVLIAKRIGRGGVGSILSGFLFFWIIAGIFQAVVAQQRARDLQERLAQAELQNLRSQLQPHFLFNTLHTISVLMRQDVEASNRVLLKLSELLRVSLDHTRRDRITLQQELDFLENYLSIEQTRFEDRLAVSIDADAESRAAMIPTLLLQPFVENAIRHGIAPRAAGGKLEVAARRTGDKLELRVEDNGGGLPADFGARRARGCGIRNVEERVRALYRGAGRVEITSKPGGRCRGDDRDSV